MLALYLGGYIYTPTASSWICMQHHHSYCFNPCYFIFLLSNLPLLTWYQSPLMLPWLLQWQFPQSQSKNLHTCFVYKTEQWKLFLWKQQVFAVIRGHNLLHFLDSTEIPQSFLPSKMKLMKHKHYLLGVQVARSIVSFLALIIHDRGNPDKNGGMWYCLKNQGNNKHVFCRTNKSLGPSTRSYAAKHKDTLSINDSLSKVKNIVDRLASFGHNVFASDHIEAIINALPEAYDTFVKILPK